MISPKEGISGFQKREISD